MPEKQWFGRYVALSGQAAWNFVMRRGSRESVKATAARHANADVREKTGQLDGSLLPTGHFVLSSVSLLLTCSSLDLLSLFTAEEEERRLLDSQ